MKGLAPSYFDAFEGALRWTSSPSLNDRLEVRRTAVIIMLASLASDDAVPGCRRLVLNCDASI
jgi:hypothetical protein